MPKPIITRSPELSPQPIRSSAMPTKFAMTVHFHIVRTERACTELILVHIPVVPLPAF
jgi:hypothetical protein